MEITPHVEALKAALLASAPDDEAAAAAAERLAQAVGPALQLQLLDMLGQVALEVTGQLPSGRVDLQLAGRDALLVFSDPAGDVGPSPADDDAGTARLTLRMSDSLKTAVEQAAADEGMSTNAWLVAAAKRGLDPGRGRRGRPTIGSRISGYTQA